MLDDAARRELAGKIAEIRGAGTFKEERVLQTPQGARIRVAPGREVLNFCANNYLGLASHPRVVEAAHAALDRWGYGMSSVRFICGTQEVHAELERNGWRSSSARRRPSCTPPASTPTAASSSRSSTRTAR